MAITNVGSSYHRQLLEPAFGTLETPLRIAMSPFALLATNYFSPAAPYGDDTSVNDSPTARDVLDYTMKDTMCKWGCSLSRLCFQPLRPDWN